jgi:hypothetical protein
MTEYGGNRYVLGPRADSPSAPRAALVKTRVKEKTARYGRDDTLKKSEERPPAARPQSVAGVATVKF